MTTISAQTILRSRNTARPDKVLSTLLLRYPRCIHAELMTHRQFSRNAASSRAIPVEKLIQDVMDDPFVPVYWGANQKGMQAGAEIDNLIAIPFGGPTRGDQLLTNEEAWLYARNRAVDMAEAFAKAGYHKQIVNRLLEPFAHITVLVSSTEWSNFLALRDHPAAEPHIQMLACAIRKELERTDNIQTLEPGDWHLPFTPHMFTPGPDNQYIKLSAACCASTSYKTVDGFDMTLERANEIYAKLVEVPPLHASPFEHVAQTDGWTYQDSFDNDRWHNPEQHGNFVGFRQFRKQLSNECL